MIDWKKKSAMAVVAGGLFGVPEAQAQPINTNLVLNPSFEVPGSGNVSNWSGTALGTYAYSQGYTSINVPPAAGLLYNAGLSGTPSSNTTQTINLVAAGFTPAFLDAGAPYTLSAFFSTYASSNPPTQSGDEDHASITLNFLDGGGISLGMSTSIGGDPFITSLGRANNINGLPGYTDWGQASTGGFMPVGTRSVAVNILHTRLAGTSNDGYVDLVNFQVVPEPGTLLLTTSAGVALVLRLRRRPAEKKA